MIIYRPGLDVKFYQRVEDGRVVHLEGVVSGEPIEMKVTLIPVYVSETDERILVDERCMLWKFRVVLENENGIRVGRRVTACDAATAGIIAAKDRTRKLKIVSIDQLEHVQ
jgi:hypothetical protein